MNRDAVVEGALQLALLELLRQRLVLEVPLAAPGAGQELVQAVPAGEVWEVLQCAYRFSTSAVVANRRTSLRIRDPNGLLIGQSDGAQVQAAGVVQDYVYTVGQPVPLLAVVSKQPLPAQFFTLPPGFVISTITQAIDVGDAYTNAVLIVRQWSTHEVEQNLDWLAKTLY